jgi:hypothetical protein
MADCNGKRCPPGKRNWLDFLGEGSPNGSRWVLQGPAGMVLVLWKGAGLMGRGRGWHFGRGQDMQGSLFVRVVGGAYVGFVWCIARRYGTFLGL